MKTVIFLLFFSASLLALEITDWALPSSKRLVEVSFSDNDLNDPQSSQLWVTLYISERERGGVRESWSGIDGKSYVWSHPEFEAQQKAKRCLSLLASTAQPQALPEDPRRVLTVRWAEGWIERRFPIDRVPAQIRDILLTVGFCDENFKRLTFFQ